MNGTETPTLFTDAPRLEQLRVTIQAWHQPAAPTGLAKVTSALTAESESLVKPRLSRINSPDYRSRLEVRLISWLYDFVQANVKRGRLFDLRQVLQQGSADCLGYSKLFSLLGRLLGLETGVVEVVIDNQGRYVPHTAILVRLANQQPRLVDLWYGSKNIRHQRLGLSVKRGQGWQVEDVDRPELPNLAAVTYLPDPCVNAITLYIQGNQHLNQQEFASAVECYTQAIKLYPSNSRLFYNRAIAWENLGEGKKAATDYTRAFSNEAAVIRILAREHEAVTSLINLDNSPG